MIKPIIFTALLVVAGAFFARTVLRLYRLMARGRTPDLHPTDRVGMRVLSVLIYFFGQKKVAERMSYDKPPGATSYHHLIIFWGFLVVTIGTIEFIVNGIVPAFSLRFLGPVATFLYWSIDIFSVLVLAMLAYAVVRRVIIKPRLIPMSLDAGLILAQIATLMISHFGLHGGHYATQLIAGVDTSEVSYGPVSDALGRAMVGLGSGAHIVSEVSYWLHASVLLFFLNYLPYSKHIHILGALPNIYFRELGQRGIMPKLNLDDDNDWGVGKIEQFSHKSLMDQYACTECARCSNFCPAFNTDKPLSPMHLIHDLKDEMIERGSLTLSLETLKKQAGIAGKSEEEATAALEKAPEALRTELKAVEEKLAALPPLVGGRIKDETLWSCTTCGACQEVCPVFINHPLKIQQMKSFLVLSESRMPMELQRTFQNLERRGNPWGSADERMAWAEGLEVKVPTTEDNPNPEYLLFIGCAASFDDRIKKSMRALVEVLHAAQVSFAVLGEKEGCSGDPARRAGNEMIFQEQAQANVEAMNEAKIKKVVTSCPHCFHTIRNEYPQFGGNFEVLHHSELLSHLISTGKLKPEEKIDKKVTFHDSCYLGRWNNVYDAPREVLNSVIIGPPSEKFGKVVELNRSREHGFCCGAGGGRMWQEEHGPRVNRNRTDEILQSGAEIAAVACPFCTIMITDGVKDANQEEKVQVLDIAEVVRKSLKNIQAKKDAEQKTAEAAPPSA